MSVFALGKSIENLENNLDYIPLTVIEKARDHDFSQLCSNQYLTPTVYSSGFWRVSPLNDSQIIGASYSKFAGLWTLDESNIENSQFKTLKGHKKQVLSIAVISNEKFCTGSSDGSICMWDKEGSKLQTIYEDGPKKERKGFYSMTAVDPHTLVTGSCQKPKQYNGEWEHTLQVWDLETMSSISSSNEHTGGISSIVKLTNNKIATSSADKSVRIWSVDNLETVRRIDVHDDYIYGLTSCGYNQLITASKDRTIKILDVETASEIGSLNDKDNCAHTSTVYDVKSYGLNIIASASRDGFVKLWDTRSYECINILDLEGRFVYAVNFNSQGMVLAGTSSLKKNNESDDNLANSALVSLWDLR